MNWLEKKLLIWKAARLAKKAHKGQTHGDRPYWHHVRDVANVLKRFGFGSDHELICAAWLHDTVEDTSVTHTDICTKFGCSIDMLVWAVTNPPGLTRKEAHKVVYPRIKRIPRADILKLADKIANTESSIYDPNKKRGLGYLKMYGKEGFNFRHEINQGSPESAPMWEHLFHITQRALLASSLTKVTKQPGRMVRIKV